jgi:hypothetical protein
MKSFFYLFIGGAIGLVIGAMVGSRWDEPQDRPVQVSHKSLPADSARAVYVLSQAEYRKDRRFSDILWTVAVAHMAGPEGDALVEKVLHGTTQGFEDGSEIYHIKAPRE